MKKLKIIIIIFTMLFNFTHNINAETLKECEDKGGFCEGISMKEGETEAICNECKVE